MRLRAPLLFQARARKVSFFSRKYSECDWQISRRRAKLSGNSVKILMSLKSYRKEGVTYVPPVLPID